MLDYRWATRPATGWEGQGHRVVAEGGVEVVYCAAQGGKGGQQGVREGRTTSREPTGSWIPMSALLCPFLLPGAGHCCCLRKERAEGRERKGGGGGAGTAPPDRRLSCWEGGEGGTAPPDRRRTCWGGEGFGGGEGACTAKGGGLGGLLLGGGGRAARGRGGEWGVREGWTTSWVGSAAACLKKWRGRGQVCRE